MHFKVRSILLACGCGTTLFSSGPSVAAADKQDEVVLAEVVVTAQRREETLREVPLAVQAIQPDRIEKSGAKNVTDLVEMIPGASVVASEGAGFDTVQIRGIASGNFGDSLIGFYIDDTAFGIPNIQLVPPGGLLDLARVEVIRGPSGTLYGQGSMGGTIKLVTNQPNSQRFSGQVFGEGSSTTGGAGNYDAGAIVNVPILQDRLAVRASGEYSFLSGYADVPDAQRTHGNDVRSSNVRVAVRWTPTDDVNVSAFYWHTRDDQDYFNFLSTVSPPQILGTGPRAGFAGANLDVFAGTLNWLSSIGNVMVGASYFDHKLGFVEPFTTAAPVPALGLTFFLPSIVDDTFKTHQFTQEVRVTSKDGSPVKWLLGGFYRDATINNDLLLNFDETVFAIGNVAPINATGPLSTRSWSGYSEVSVPLFGGKFEPLIGVRYFHDHRTFTETDFAAFPRSVPIMQPTTAADWSSTNPRFNLKYKPTDNGLVYINIAKGFRSGSIQTQAQANVTNVALGLAPGTVKPQVDPDSLWTYELGTRWQLTRTVIAEASYYHTDWHDVIVQFAVPALGDFISVVNGGNARIDGADFGLSWLTPLNGLTISANGNFENARIVSAIPALAATTNFKAGARMPNVPRDNFTVSTDYTHALSWFGGSIGSLYAAYAYRDRQIDASAMTAPGVPLESGEINDVTLRAGLKKGDWSIDAFVYNALNDRGPLIGAPNYSGLLPADVILYPRRTGVRMTIKF